MSKKYVVIPESEFTPAIQAHLKNYNSAGNALFRQDTPETVRRLTRKDNEVVYVLLKVLENTPTARVRQVLSGHGQGNDKFKQIYNDNPAFRDFLTENFD